MDGLGRFRMGNHGKGVMVVPANYLGDHKVEKLGEKMNRKVAVIALLSAVLFIGMAYAQPGGINGNQNSSGQGVSGQSRGNGCGGFVDEDGDGICDNYQSGQCHMYGYGGFIDEDGDGICDNYQSGQCYRHCNGGCDGFVDEDGDGICDNCQSQCGEGYQRGNGRGRP